MFSRISRRGRGKSTDQTPGMSATEVLDYLNPDLRSALASLHGAPQSVAEAAVQLMPFGSRAGLESITPPLATTCGTSGDEGFRPLKLTPFAYEVMAAAAAQAEADQPKSRELDTAALQAVRDITEQSANRP